MTDQRAQQTYRTAGWVDWIGGAAGRYGHVMNRLANAETRMVERWLQEHPVTSPIFIGGLACTGATILLEVLNRHPDVGAHQYRDFPLVQLPYWWNSLLDRVERNRTAPAEPEHSDRILVTPSSPEAMEEIVWMHWFPTMHDPRASNVLGGSTEHAAFEQFYRNHIGKVLLTRGAGRYLSKGNYSLARLAYLLRLFPDARFVIPIRSPFTQIPALMRQHRRLTESLSDNPKGRARLNRVGYFEIGPDRRPMNIGDNVLTASIEQLWAEGDEVRGWARYWAAVNTFVAGQLDADVLLGGACKVVRYEDLCNAPREVLADIFDHAGLDAPDAPAARFAEQLQAPDYHDPSLSEQDIAIIREEAGPAAARFGCYL